MKRIYILSVVLPYFVANSRIVGDDLGALFSTHPFLADKTGDEKIHRFTGCSIPVPLTVHRLPLEMSDFLKKFKSVFIVEDENAEAKNKNQAQQPAAQHSAEMTAPPPKQRTESGTAGSVSDKFVEILTAALEKNNQQGFDYFEFRQALRNLAKMPMDEATRFHSAFAMAQTMGITPDKLVESAQFYLSVLANEQSRFNEAHAQQRARLIGNREEEVKNLEATIQQKAEQIKQLTQQIEEHRQRSEQIRQEISDSTVKIENTKADFEATFANVTGNIQEDINKIQQYLK